MKKYRRWLSLGVGLALVLLFAKVCQQAPVPVQVVYRFGGERTELRRLTATYLSIGDQDQPGNIGSLIWNFGEDGAPAEKVHQTKLLPGMYAVEIKLTTADGDRTLAGEKIQVPEAADSRVIVEVDRRP